MTSLCFFRREERAVPSPKGLCHQNIAEVDTEVTQRGSQNEQRKGARNGSEPCEGARVSMCQTRSIDSSLMHGSV